MHGRDGKHVGEVVETAVGRVVAGKQRLHVEVEIEEIADGVVVFGAIEAMHGTDSAGIRVRRPCLIDLVFERRGHYAIGRGIGARHLRRRHCAGAELGYDLFQHLCVGSGFGEIERIEGEAGSVQFLVVAGDAVFVEEGAGSGLRG